MNDEVDLVPVLLQSNNEPSAVEQRREGLHSLRLGNVYFGGKYAQVALVNRCFLVFCETIENNLVA